MCTENIALHAEYTDNMCREKRETKNIHISSSLLACPYMGQIDNASLITNSTLLRESNTVQYLQTYIYIERCINQHTHQQIYLIRYSQLFLHLP